LIPTTQPDSLPFLLLRPNAPAMKSDVLEDDAETTEIPASKSVPPHSPPAPVSTTEHELPSVIVDLCDLEASEAAEIQRATDVDGLLTASETIEFPLFIEEEPTLDGRSETLKSAPKRPAARAGTARGRGFAIAAVAAITAAGGTFAGLRVYHVSGFPLSAATHLVR
jgi:hypothetical protein